MELLYFAWVRERIGTGSERVEPPADIATLGELIAWLARRSPGHAAALADPTALRAAVDQRFARMGEPVTGAREVAIFPPVTGG